MTLRLALALALVAACSSASKPSTQSPSETAIEPAPVATLEAGRIVLSEPIGFEPGDSKLAASSEGVLGALADLLRDRADLTMVRIESHIGSEGDPDGAQELSQDQAASIAHWLVGHGIDCARLIAVGFGASKPVSADEPAQNTRIELVPAALRGTPIGGMPVDGGGQVSGDDLCR